MTPLYSFQCLAIGERITVSLPPTHTRRRPFGERRRRGFFGRKELASYTCSCTASAMAFCQNGDDFRAPEKETVTSMSMGLTIGHLDRFRGTIFSRVKTERLHVLGASDRTLWPVVFLFAVFDGRPTNPKLLGKLRTGERQDVLSDLSEVEFFSHVSQDISWAIVSIWGFSWPFIP